MQTVYSHTRSPFPDNSSETREVSNDHYIERAYNCVSGVTPKYRQSTELLYFRLSILENRSGKREKRGRDNRRSCPIRQTSDRERRKGSAALTRSVLFILPKCFRIFPARGELGQEVRLRSGRNLSRARNPLPVSFPPFLTIRFYFVPPFDGGWRAKGFRPADEANEFGSARCTLVRSKGVGRWKVGGGGGRDARKGGGEEAGGRKGIAASCTLPPGAAY